MNAIIRLLGSSLKRPAARFSLSCLACATLFVAVLALRHTPVRSPQPFSSSIPSLRDSSPGTPASPLGSSVILAGNRPIFPYSIVPGGVRDARELRSAVAADPVVAAHYTGFRFAAAHTVRLNHPAAMFVSYRIGDRVFWTRRKLLIPAQETLISDGETLARARCGNRLSSVAAGPVAASDPPWEKLSEPAVIPQLLAQFDPPYDPAVVYGAAPLLANFPQPASPNDPDGSVPVGAFGPIFLPGSSPSGERSSEPSTPGHPGGGTPTPLTPSIANPPPIVTPEPQTLLLLLSGALLFVARAAQTARFKPRP